MTFLFSRLFMWELRSTQYHHIIVCCAAGLPVWLAAAAFAPFLCTDADVLTNPTLAETFRANWDIQDTDLTFRSADEDKAIARAGGGSTDMGNVSHIMPGWSGTAPRDALHAMPTAFVC